MFQNCWKQKKCWPEMACSSSRMTHWVTSIDMNWYQKSRIWKPIWHVSYRVAASACKKPQGFGLGAPSPTQLPSDMETWCYDVPRKWETVLGNACWRFLRAFTIFLGDEDLICYLANEDLTSCLEKEALICCLESAKILTNMFASWLCRISKEAYTNITRHIDT